MEPSGGLSAPTDFFTNVFKTLSIIILCRSPTHWPKGRLMKKRLVVGWSRTHDPQILLEDAVSIIIYVYRIYIHSTDFLFIE